jgi:hypothetical protein
LCRPQLYLVSQLRSHGSWLFSRSFAYSPPPGSRRSQSAASRSVVSARCDCGSSVQVPTRLAVVRHRVAQRNQHRLIMGWRRRDSPSGRQESAENGLTTLCLRPSRMPVTTPCNHLAQRSASLAEKDDDQNADATPWMNAARAYFGVWTVLRRSRLRPSA